MVDSGSALLRVAMLARSAFVPCCTCCPGCCSNEHAASIAGRGFVAKVADFGLARTLIHGSKVITKTYGKGGNLWGRAPALL